MRSCYQFQEQSVLDHGISVRFHYLQLKHLILSGSSDQDWRFPRWITSQAVKDFLLDADESVMELYQLYHDCGKPMCLTIDEQGRKHFPNHASVSKQTWIRYSDQHIGRNAAIADLIGMDMDAHLLKPSSVEEFASRPQAIALLVTAVAEIHSNAAMFGGIESEGFKRKFSNLDRLGGRVVSLLEKR